MPLPTPDPSASLLPYQVYQIARDGYIIDAVHWISVVVFVGLSLLLVFAVIIAVAVAYRR